jgi:hypothetical protein
MPEGRPRPIGRKTALAAIAIALVVLGAGAVVLAPHVREWWEIRRLAAAESPEEKQTIAASLEESGTVRAIEPLWGPWRRRSPTL